MSSSATASEVGATAGRSREAAAARPSLIVLLGTIVLFLVLIGRVVETYLQRGLFDFIGEDYAIYAATARVVRSLGWSRFYDLGAIAHETLAFTVHYGAFAGPLRPGPSPYPVVFLLPFLALDRFGDVGGFVGWTVLNLGLLMVMARGSGARPRALMGFLAPVVYFPAAYNLIVGQLAIVMAFGLHRFLKEARAGRELAAGMWLALLLIKPQFALVPLVVLIGLRRWRILAGFTTVGFAMAGSTLALVGAAGVGECLAILRSFSGFRLAPAVVDPWDMINIRGLLLGLPEDWVSEGTGASLTIAISLVLIASLRGLWRSGWDAADPRFDRKMLATMIVAMLTAYHNHVHGAALLVPVMLAVLEHDPDRRRFAPLAALATLAPTGLVAATGVVKYAAWCLIAVMTAAYWAIRREETSAAKVAAEADDPIIRTCA